MSVQQPEPIFVCNMDALSKEQRAAHQANTTRLFSAIHAVRELPTGYALQLPGETEMLRMATEFISNERLCCPFFHFVLEVELEHGPIWLHLIGNSDVKPFLRSEVSFLSSAASHLSKEASQES